MYSDALNALAADITAPPPGLLESVQQATRDAARQFAVFAVAVLKANKLYALAADYHTELRGTSPFEVSPEDLVEHVKRMVANGSIDPADLVLAELGIG